MRERGANPDKTEGKKFKKEVYLQETKKEFTSIYLKKN
jgi:hypothetical protein